jgi:hypothetical protein
VAETSSYFLEASSLGRLQAGVTTDKIHAEYQEFLKSHLVIPIKNPALDAVGTPLIEKGRDGILEKQFATDNADTVSKGMWQEEISMKPYLESRIYEAIIAHNNESEDNELISWAKSLDTKEEWSGAPKPKILNAEGKVIPYLEMNAAQQFAFRAEIVRLDAQGEIPARIIETSGRYHDQGEKSAQEHFDIHGAKKKDWSAKHSGYVE